MSRVEVGKAHPAVEMALPEAESPPNEKDQPTAAEEVPPTALNAQMLSIMLPPDFTATLTPDQLLAFQAFLTQIIEESRDRRNEYLLKKPERSSVDSISYIPPFGLSGLYIGRPYSISRDQRWTADGNEDAWTSDEDV